MKKLLKIFWNGIKKPFSSVNNSFFGLLIFAPIPYIYFLTGFLGMGYLLRVGEYSINKKQDLPEWKDFLNIFKIGIKGWLIVFFYFIPLSLILFLIFLLSSFKISFPSISQNIIPNVVNYFNEMRLILGMFSYLFIAMIGLLYLFTLYLFPVALLRFAKNQKFSTAFKLKDIISASFSMEYFVSWFILEIVPLIYAAIIFIFSIKFLDIIIPTNYKYAYIVLFYFLVGLKQYFLGILSYTVYGTILREKLK